MSSSASDVFSSGRGWTGLVPGGWYAVLTEPVGSGSDVEAGRQVVLVGLAVWLFGVCLNTLDTAVFSNSQTSLDEQFEI